MIDPLDPEPLGAEAPLEIVILPPAPAAPEAPGEILAPPRRLEALATAPARGARGGRLSWAQVLVLFIVPGTLVALSAWSVAVRSPSRSSAPAPSEVPATLPVSHPAPAPAPAFDPPTPLPEKVQTIPSAPALARGPEGSAPAAAKLQGGPPAPTLDADIDRFLSAAVEAEPAAAEARPAPREPRAGAPEPVAEAEVPLPAAPERAPRAELAPVPAPAPKRNPAEEQALRLLGEACALETDQPALAAAHYRQVLELDPARTSLWKTVADLDLRRGALDEATREYREYLRVHPERPDALQNLALLHLKGGRYDEARTCLESALKYAPSADLYYDLGNLELAASKPEPAVAAYRRSLEYEPHHPEARFNLALALDRLGKKGEALAALEALGTVSPEVTRQRARLEAMMGGIEGDRALSLARTSTDVEMVMSVAAGFHRAGELEKALALLDHAVEIAPHQATALLNRGVVRQAMGRLAEASADFEEAARVAPSLAEAPFNLGVLEEERGQYVAALGHYRAALKANPVLPCALNNIGILYLKVGQPERAADCFRRCREADPSFVSARLNLAWAELALGAKEKAREELKAYLQESPKEGRSPDAARVLAELEGARGTAEVRR